MLLEELRKEVLRKNCAHFHYDLHFEDKEEKIDRVVSDVVTALKKLLPSYEPKKKVVTYDSSYIFTYFNGNKILDLEIYSDGIWGILTENDSIVKYEHFTDINQCTLVQQFI